MPQGISLHSATPHEQTRNARPAQNALDKVTLSSRSGPIAVSDKAKENFRSVSRNLSGIATGVGKNIDIYV